MMALSWSEMRIADLECQNQDLRRMLMKCRATIRGAANFNLQWGEKHAKPWQDFADEIDAILTPRKPLNAADIAAAAQHGS